MAGHDAVFAQLMGMGFDPEAIEDCQVAMATSSESFSLQAATEWSAVVICTVHCINTCTLKAMQHKPNPKDLVS